jgi:CheY-like chemotaxis protein
MVVERQIQPVEARFHSSGFVVRSPIDDTGKAGMNEHLAKPIEPETLYARLASYFR